MSDLVIFFSPSLSLVARATVMAFATWLNSCTLSRALLPIRYHQPTFSSSRIRLGRFNFSVLLSPSSDQTRYRFMTLQAEARRGFSIRDFEVASADDLRFESPLKIVEYPDPCLRAKNKRIQVFDENLKKLVDEMFDVMYKTDGIGLSAPQVGINVQLMVFNPVGERSEGEEIVLVNPRVNKYSKKIVLFNEGCLSFPGIFGDVERPETIKIDAMDIGGKRFTVSLSGLPARIFQHEFDHLQGTLFFDRMSDEVLDGIRAELEALEKKYEDRTGLPSPEKIESQKRKKVAAGFGKS